MHKQIEVSERFTAEKMAEMRSALKNQCRGKSYSVLTGGSFARGEASPESDLDWFVICDTPEATAEAHRDLPAIASVLERSVPKPPSTGGAFAKVELIDEMARNIGGEDDKNSKITRRVLYLLEGAYLHDEERFLQYRDQILGKYIQPTISDHTFCRFLLNDLIRYYRTICVDFEHKTREENKAWGTRNIKLIFSRKLLYFSGVLAAAETWQYTYTSKMEKIRGLFALTPIRRIETVCGSRADRALSAYGEFLKKLSDPSVRMMLDSTTDVRAQQSDAFRLLKNEGHHFSLLLTKLLKDTYDEAHPIHNALVV